MDNSQDVGYLKGKVEAVEKDVAEIKSDMKAQNTKLDTIVRFVERQRGGFAVMASMSAGFGALAGIAVAWFHK